MRQLAEALARGVGRLSDEFLQSLTPQVARRDLAIVSAVFLVAFSAFATLTPNALVNGDAAVYAQQIRSSDFSQRSVHIGYFVLGYLLRPLFPAVTDYTLNLMSGLLGALTLSVVYLLALSFVQSRYASLCATALLATNYVFVSNSVYAEVYIGQCFFLLLAFFLWIRNRPISSGVGFAAATLMTPSALLAAPSFLAIKPRLRPLLKLAIAVSVILAIFIIPRYDDYLFSGRGVLKGLSGGLDLGTAIGKETSELLFGMFLSLPFVMLGLVELQKHRFRALGLAVFLLWLFSLLFGEKFRDVPVQLPTYAFLCLIGALGVNRLRETAKTASRTWRIAGVWIVAFLASIPLLALVLWPPRAKEIQELSPLLPLLFAGALLLATSIATVLELRRRRELALSVMLGACIMVNGLFCLGSIRNKNRRVVSYRDTVQELGRLAQPGYLAVGDWSPGILFEHYLFADSYTGRWIDSDYLTGSGSVRRQRRAREIWTEALDSGREVWLLDGNRKIMAELEDRGYSIQRLGEVYRAYK